MIKVGLYVYRRCQKYIVYWICIRSIRRCIKNYIYINTCISIYIYIYIYVCVCVDTMKIGSNANQRDRMRECGVDSSGLAYELVNLARKLYSYFEISDCVENLFSGSRDLPCMYTQTDGQSKFRRRSIRLRTPLNWSIS
jgi:hypothetical protein